MKLTVKYTFSRCFILGGIALGLDKYIFPWQTYFWGGGFVLDLSSIQVNTVCIFKLFSFYVLFPGKCSIQKYATVFRGVCTWYAITGTASPVPGYSFVLQKLKSFFVCEKLP
jgi:hypothetical protein